MNPGHPGRPVRVLMLEESAGDAAAIIAELWRSDIAFRTRRVDSGEAFAAALNDFAPDVILLDCVAREVNVLGALEMVQAAAPAVPVIIVTGFLDDIIVAQLLGAGAVDYLMKDRLARLSWAIQRALASAGQPLPRARATEQSAPERPR